MDRLLLARKVATRFGSDSGLVFGSIVLPSDMASTAKVFDGVSPLGVCIYEPPPASIAGEGTGDFSGSG